MAGMTSGPENPYGEQDPGVPPTHQPYGAPPPPSLYGAPPPAPSPYGAPPFGGPPPGLPALPGYYGYQPQPSQPVVSSGLYVAAAVINWVVLGLVILATCGIGIIAAAWYIPMTIKIHKGARDRYKHTALGVCTLLFCNIISGILMLVEDGNREPRPLT
jgi:hypothetical protein